jgi:cobalt-zinc-cadmium efflux system membrane fusion protein
VVLAADSPKLSRIKVANVEQAEVALNEVVAPGVIEVNPNRMAQVLMPVAGRVKQVLARLGDSVKQGQQLVSIESPEVGAAISAYRQAEAAVTQARATAGKAEADLARVSDLYAHRAIAQKEVLNAENMLSQARTEIEQKRAARDEALRRLEILGLRPGEFSQDIAARAPISGKVVEIRVVAGEYRNDTSTPLLRIADLGTVWVAADVPEALIRFVSLGERIEVELPAYPGEIFPGRVTRIADSADPQTRSIKVRAEMSNPAGRFRPEMFARIRHLQNVRTLPVVPPGAVIQGEGRAIVYLERAPGVFLEREVELGPRNGDRMPVLSGLKPGDRIVVDGAMLLRTS